MAMRYAVFHVGYTAKGVYFAARTSVPKLPQTLTDVDTVTLTLLPPGTQTPQTFTVRTSDSVGELPAACVAAVHPLKGVTDYAVFCAPYVQQNDELDRLARQEGMRVMTVPRVPFGGKHPPDKDYGKYIDAQLAKKPKALDFLIHGITVATGGWGPFFDEKDFSDFLDAIAERERRGLIRVVPYAEAYAANEREMLK